jgi:2-keto-myo-inositol isomerase
MASWEARHAEVVLLMPDQASLNLATIRAATLEDKLYAARAAGFRAVGLNREEILSVGEEGRAEVRLSDLAVSDLVGLPEWMDVQRTSRVLAMMQAEETFKLAADLDCPLVVALPSSGPIDPVAAAASFQELCRAAVPFGVRVGLEFVGTHEQVGDLAAAWRIVEVAAADNGGLVIDAFHFYRGGSTVDMFELVPGDKIYLVQISDCVDLPRYQLEDRHRVYPGGGSLPLESLLAAVRAKGYSGHYSLELHNEYYWQENALVVAREGLRAMRRLGIESGGD